MSDGFKLIRPARAAEADRLGGLVAASFRHLDVANWLVADPDVRLRAMGGQFGILVAHAIEHGDVHVVDGDDGEPAGVAVWFAPGEIPEIERYDERLAEICGEHTRRFAQLDELMHGAHPAEPDHAYLALLGVREDMHSRGIGTALIEAHHAVLDAVGEAAYLEASGLRSRELYLRHGYRDYADPYGIDGASHFYPMWREPTES